MSDIEHLHQLILNLAARLQATEALATTAIAMLCASTDKPISKDSFVKDIFPRLLHNAANAPGQATKPELDTWMRQREQDFLNQALQKIIAKADAETTSNKTGKGKSEPKPQTSKATVN